jgi:hypothetical protein
VAWKLPDSGWPLVATDNPPIIGLANITVARLEQEVEVGIDK